MLSALQVNIAGGRLPPPEHDGRCYLKIPLNVSLKPVLLTRAEEVIE